MTCEETSVFTIFLKIMAAVVLILMTFYYCIQIFIPPASSQIYVPASSSGLSSILSDFANVHSYNLTSYNCLNYSTDLSFVLNSLGYSSKVIIFSTNGDGSHGHAIVRIDSIYVEPQSGKIYGSFESLLNGEDLTASETNQTSVIPQEYLPVTCVDGVCE